MQTDREAACRNPGTLMRDSFSVSRMLAVQLYCHRPCSTIIFIGCFCTSGGWGALSIRPILDQFIVQLVRFQRFTSSGDPRLLAVGPRPPYVHSMSLTSCLLPSLLRLLLPCIIVNATKEQKKGGVLGNEAKVHRTCLI